MKLKGNNSVAESVQVAEFFVLVIKCVMCLTYIVGAEIFVSVVLLTDSNKSKLHRTGVVKIDGTLRAKRGNLGQLQATLKP